MSTGFWTLLTCFFFDFKLHNLGKRTVCWSWNEHLAFNYLVASRTSKKVGPVKKTGVLEEEPGSSKPISYIWVSYGLNKGFVRFKYGFCADETHLFWQKPFFSWKLKKNRFFEKRPTNSWVLEALGIAICATRHALYNITLTCCPKLWDTWSKPSAWRSHALRLATTCSHVRTRDDSITVVRQPRLQEGPQKTSRQQPVACGKGLPKVLCFNMLRAAKHGRPGLIFVGSWAHATAWPRSLTRAFAGGALFHGRCRAATGADAWGAAGRVEFLNFWILSTTFHLVLGLATSQFCANSPFLPILVSIILLELEFRPTSAMRCWHKTSKHCCPTIGCSAAKPNVAVSTRVWCSEKVNKIWRLYIPTSRKPWKMKGCG